MRNKDEYRNAGGFAVLYEWDPVTSSSCLGHKAFGIDEEVDNDKWPGPEDKHVLNIMAPNKNIKVLNNKAFKLECSDETYAMNIYNTNISKGYIHIMTNHPKFCPDYAEACEMVFDLSRIDDISRHVVDKLKDLKPTSYNLSQTIQIVSDVKELVDCELHNTYIWTNRAYESKYGYLAKIISTVRNASVGNQLKMHVRPVKVIK